VITTRLADAGVVLITSGVNEKTGGATDRNDPQGRLRLLEKNAAIYRAIVPQIVRAAPKSVLVAVTDPPDPLADIARDAAGHDRVLSTGTFPTACAFASISESILASIPPHVGAQVIGDPRYLAGLPVVVASAHCRCAGDGTPKERGENSMTCERSSKEMCVTPTITIIEGHDA